MGVGIVSLESLGVAVGLLGYFIDRHSLLYRNYFSNYSQNIWGVWIVSLELH
jgi:hypothetical protein